MSWRGKDSRRTRDRRPGPPPPQGAESTPPPPPGSTNTFRRRRRCGPATRFSGMGPGRSSQGRMVGGVFAGLSDYLGIETWKLRLAFLFCLFFFPPPSIFLYVMAWIFLPRRDPPEGVEAPEAKAFRQSVARKPGETLRSLRYRFLEMEDRLAKMERHVTSDEARLAREIDGLK